MHRFTYKKNKLYCEDIGLDKLADKFGTPSYVYSRNTLLDHFNKLEKAFKQLNPLICFSMKSNSNLAVVKTLVDKGSGLDIVSGGELFKALRVGCSTKKIVYASVGKKPEEIKQAIDRGILIFNVESEPELLMINKLAGRHKKVKVALRVNPDVDAHTHKHITTGKSGNKFGIDYKRALHIFRQKDKYKNLSLEGLHIHIGSQITKSEPFVKAIKKTLNFIDKNNLDIRYFNIGGGLGIIYSDEKPQTAEKFAKKIIPLLKNRKFNIILEPGRFIVGNSGALITRVIYVKKSSGGKHFAIVDAGMNDLLRPSLYDAYHEILPVKRYTIDDRRYTIYDVVGPICESGDFLAKGRKLKALKAGDLLAVMSAGAYGFTMSSNYNSRPRPAEVLVNKNKVRLAKRRETYNDLIRNEYV